jgi:hypothetical protein
MNEKIRKALNCSVFVDPPVAVRDCLVIGLEAAIEIARQHQPSCTVVDSIVDDLSTLAAQVRDGEGAK